MNKYKLWERNYCASTNKPSWDIIDEKTGEVIASFYYKLPARDRLKSKKQAIEYMETLKK